MRTGLRVRMSNALLLAYHRVKASEERSDQRSGSKLISSKFETQLKRELCQRLSFTKNLIILSSTLDCVITDHQNTHVQIPELIMPLLSPMNKLAKASSIFEILSIYSTLQ